MPIYEYKCSKYGRDFSHISKRMGEEAPACPDCGSREVRKHFSTFTAKASGVGLGGEHCPHADRCHRCLETVDGGSPQCCPGCGCHNH